MNADQVIEGIGNAVAGAKPSQEYCLLWVDYWPLCMTKSEWAGWVQAVGSVLAIVVGVVLVWYQLRVQRLEAAARAAESDRAHISSGLQMLLGRTSQTKLLLQQISKWLANGNVPWIELSDIASHLSNHLDRIPMTEFPHPPAAAMFISLRAAFVRIAQQISECARIDSYPGEEIKPERLEKLRKMTNDLSAAADRSHIWLHAEVNAFATKSERNKLQAAVDALKSKNQPAQASADTAA